MKLIGNTESKIDWNKIINQCLVKPGQTLNYNRGCFPNTDDFDKMDAMMQQAGYQYGTDAVEWINYFPNDNFDQEVVDTFSNIVSASPWMVWISRIRPGKMTPWHWDAHQSISEFKKLPNPVRYTCYIQSPHDGHISIVDESVIYKPAQGSIYQWPTCYSWHAGLNCGYADKYMFNFWGYQPQSE
jgi:hypothetical protein